MIGLTKNLTPSNPSIQSPLRELDWTDDDITMEVVSGRLYERDLNEIFDSPNFLNDRGGDTTYYPSMAEHGDHVIKIAVPPKVLHLIEQIALENHDTELSDAIRLACVHGMAIYEHKYGSEIEGLYHKNYRAHIDGDNESVMRHLLAINIDFKHVKYSCKIESRFFQLLSRFAAHAGCHKQHMVGLWLLYSVRTHPKFKKWKKSVDDILSDIEPALDLRIKLLKN